MAIDNSFGLIDTLASAPKVQLPTLEPEQPKAVQTDPSSNSPEYWRNLVFNNLEKNKISDDPLAPTKIKSTAFDRYKDLKVNPMDLSLNPKFVENKYALTQGWLDRSWNDLKVFSANAGSMFAAGILTYPDIISNILAGRPLEDSPTMKSINDWRSKIEQDNPNYNTEVDDQTGTWNTVKNALLPGWLTGSAHGWGETFRSVGYGVGITGSFLTGNIAGGILGVGRIPMMANKIARYLNSTSQVEKIGRLGENIINTTRIFDNISKDLKYLNTIKEGAKWGVRAIASAYGESGFEGLETGEALNKKLQEEFYQKNGYLPIGKDLEDIQKLVEDGKAARFWSNMALLSLTQTFQLGKLFKSFDRQKTAMRTIAEKGLNIGIENGIPIAKKSPVLMGKWWDSKFGKILKPAATFIKDKYTDPKSYLLEALSEGGEEFAQEVISNSVNSYASWRLNNKGKSDISEALNSIASGLSGSLTDEGLKSFITGAMAGAGQQLLIKGVTLNQTKKLDQEFQTRLNETLQGYKNFKLSDIADAINTNSVRGTLVEKIHDANAASTINKAFEAAINLADSKSYEDLQNLNFFNLAKPYLNRGHADILKQQFNFALDGYKGDIKDLFPDFSTAEQVKTTFSKQVDELATVFDQVSRSFKNPFDANNPEQAQSAYTYDMEFIPELAYKKFRLDKLKSKANELDANLGETYNELVNFVDPDTLERGKKHIEKRIKELENPLNSYGNDADIMKKEYQSSLDKLNEFLEESKRESTEDNNSKSKNLYNEFIDQYFKTTLKYLNNNESYDEIIKDKVFQDVADALSINNDITTVQNGLKRYVSPDGFQLYVDEYLSALNEYIKHQETKSFNQKFNSVEDYENYLENAVYKYIKTGFLSVDVIENTIKKFDGSVEDLSIELDRLNEEERIRNEKIDQVILDGIKKLTNVKSDKRAIVEEELNKLGNPSVITDEIKKKLFDSLEKINSEIKPEERNIPYQDFLERANNYIRSNNLQEGLFNHSDINPDKVSISEVFNIPLLESLPINHQESILNIYRDFLIKNSYSKSKIGEVDSYLKDLKNEIPKVIQGVGYKIVKDNKDKFQLVYDSGETATFNSLDEVFSELKSQEIDDGIHNLNSKTSNGSWNPDRNGKTLSEVQEEEASNEETKNRELHKLFANLNDDELSQELLKNTTVEFYSISGAEGSIPLEDHGFMGRLDEVILGSPVADSIVLKYKNDDGVEFRYQTFKEPYNALKFVNISAIQKFISNYPMLPSERIEISRLAGKYLRNNITYYEFLKQVVANPSGDINVLFDFIKRTKLLRFKGNVQDQINSIEEDQILFENLKKAATIPNYLIDNYKIIPEFYGLTRNYTVNSIESLNHPFVYLNNKRQYGFFYLRNELTFNNRLNPIVEFINRDLNDKGVITNLIVQSFNQQALKKKNPEEFRIFPGYYMVFTDTKGKPFIEKLINKKLSSEQLKITIQSNLINDIQPLDGVDVIDTSELTGDKLSRKANIIQLPDKSLELRAFIEDGDGNRWNTFYKIPESVITSGSFEKVNSDFLKGIEFKNKDFGSKTLSLNVNFQPVVKTESGNKPTSNKDILETRDIQLSSSMFTVKRFLFKPLNDVKSVGEKDSIVPSIPENTIPTELEEDFLSINDLFNTSEIEQYLDVLDPNVKQLILSKMNVEQLDETINHIHSKLPNKNKGKLANFVLNAFAGEVQNPKNRLQKLTLNRNLDVNILNKLLESPISSNGKQIIQMFSKQGVPMKLTVNRGGAPSLFSEENLQHKVNSLIKFCHG